MRRPKRMVTCPHCGGEIEAGVPACRHCGSDERTGWSPNTYLDGVGLPDDEEYDDLVAKEFGDGAARGRRGVVWTAVIAAVLIAIFVAGAILQFM